MKTIFGSSPRSTILGLILAALIVLQDMSSAGESDWKKIALAIALALFGRLVKDSDGTNRKDKPEGNG